MARHRIFFSAFIATTAVWVALSSLATAAPPAKGDATPTDIETLAAQVKELQKQVKELQARGTGAPSPRIIAAGTANFELGRAQENATFIRIKLDADVVAKLGDDYIVLLSTRLPTGAQPLYAPYWKKAKDGFDVTLCDVTLPSGGNVSYLFKTDKIFPIDWIVVKK